MVELRVTFVWMSCLPLTRMFSLSATKATPPFGQGVEDRHDLPQRSAEPRELADDEAAGLEDASQLVEPPALLRGLPGRRRLDEVVDSPHPGRTR